MIEFIGLCFVNEQCLFARGSQCIRRFVVFLRIVIVAQLATKILPKQNNDMNSPPTSNNSNYSNSLIRGIFSVF